MPSTGAERFLPLKPDVFEVLLALSGGDLHGYAIVKELESRGTPVAASLLYRKLRRLMEDGLVSEARPPASRDSDDPRRRYYHLTRLGREVVRAEAGRIVDLANDAQVRHLVRGDAHA
jgi:DNA-binding PadR family transcriptional regulator